MRKYCLKEKITKEQLDQLYNNLKYSLISTVLLSTLIGLMFFNHEKSPKALLWLLFMLFVSLVRLIVKWRYERAKFPDIPYYFTLFLLLLVTSGAGFASLIYVLFPNSIFDQMLFIFVMAGLSAGAISSLHYSKTAVILYQISLILPIALRLFFVQGSIYPVMGFVLLFYLVMMINLSLRTYRTYINTLKLKLAYSQKQKDLSIQSQRFYYLFHNIPLGIFFYNKDLRITDCNDFFAHVLGVSKDELLGFDMNRLQDKRILPVLKEPFSKKNGWYRGFYHSTLSQKEFFIELYTTYIQVDHQIIEGLGVVIDLTRLKEYQNKIEQMAYYDELTGLAKRTVLFESIDLAIKKVKRDKKYSILIYMDLDNFKEINDTLGHNIGDLFLKTIAKRIQEYTREVDIAARMGGDEFAILLLEISEDKNRALIEGLEVAKRLAKAISQPVAIEDHTMQTTVSIGVALIDEKSKNAYEVIKFADSAMYKIKRKNKNSIQLFDQELKKEIEHLYKVKHDLERALQNREFILYLQPQFDQKRKIVGAEALLRWKHPKKGLVYPGEFLPVAEEFGMMQRISDEVLRLAKDILEKIPQKIKVAVNVSGSDIYSEHFYNHLKSLLPHSFARYLNLEITEQVLIKDASKAMENISRIKKELNIQFSIDDFGTGYSSLQYLKQLPIDYLKIDKSFVDDMFVDGNDYIIVSTIINMAKNLGLKTIAEGVETKKQFEELKDMGVDFFQGYYFAKPMPYEEFVKLLKTSSFEGR
ncbi:MULTISPECIES: bifunctional diguanylate cyclase/phosphodiesterase [unclassified Nitratiruptor]|uniref:putative bifunctional diguanylate cyclase/phosphodiesterase n=1 Tax=unclassified Nitratiruptor TaxID=2624044 RepID=UPI001915D63F|nr:MULTISPECIES: EAL domain-containing protein [unclassified Nitratiruptor]